MTGTDPALCFLAVLLVVGVLGGLATTFGGPAPTPTTEPTTEPTITTEDPS